MLWAQVTDPGAHQQKSMGIYHIGRSDCLTLRETRTNVKSPVQVIARVRGGGVRVLEVRST